MWMYRQTDKTKLIGDFCNYGAAPGKGKDTGTCTHRERHWNMYAQGKTLEHVRTMWKGVWSNEEPSEHHFKNRRESAALNISVTVLA